MARNIHEPMEILNEAGESLNLDPRYESLPLDALRRSSRTKLSLYLDEPSEIIDEESGYVTDWNGLAELVGFTGLEMKMFGRQRSPTQELLNDWESKPELNPTIGNLWKYLIELGRLDVLEDARSNVIKDAENYILTKERLKNDYLGPVQDNAVSQSADHYVDETRMLVRGDIDGSITLFDAFVCYNIDSQGKDIHFVKEMINKLEKQYDIKLCVPGRDDLPGGARYVTDAKLIESRCRRMIIVLSHDYLHSSACDFQVKFAHALAPGARSKKLIPVLIEQSVPIPQILRHVTLCDYTKNDLMEWFWDRLAKSIKAPLDPESNRYRSSMESSSSSSQLSSSNSMSSMDRYHIQSESLQNAQQQFITLSQSSGDSGFQSMNLARSSSYQSEGGAESMIDDNSFESQYVKISEEPPSTSRSQSKKKNIFKQVKGVFSKKNNTSSHA